MECHVERYRKQDSPVIYNAKHLRVPIHVLHGSRQLRNHTHASHMSKPPSMGFPCTVASGPQTTTSSSVCWLWPNCGGGASQLVVLCGEPGHSDRVWCALQHVIILGSLLPGCLS